MISTYNWNQLLHSNARRGADKYTAIQNIWSNFLGSSQHQLWRVGGRAVDRMTPKLINLLKKCGWVVIHCYKTFKLSR